MPLPLAVRTADDLAFKAAVERVYLEFNLLASGQVAYDRGDMVTATNRWEALLALPGLSPELEQVVRPLAGEARRQASGTPVSDSGPPSRPVGG